MNKKTKKNKLNLFYDKEADVLYVSKGRPSSRDISSETENEIIIRKDSKSGEVTGFTILNFSKRTSKTDLTIDDPFEFAT